MTSRRPEQLEADLSAYLDGELTAERVRAVEQHLAESAAARQVLEELRAVRDQLGGLPRFAAPEVVAATVARMPVRQVEAVVPGEVRRWRTIRLWTQVGATAAAALVLGVFIGRNTLTVGQAAPEAVGLMVAERAAAPPAPQTDGAMERLEAVSNRGRVGGAVVGERYGAQRALRAPQIDAALPDRVEEDYAYGRLSEAPGRKIEERPAVALSYGGDADGTADMGIVATAPPRGAEGGASEAADQFNDSDAFVALAEPEPADESPQVDVQVTLTGYENLMANCAVLADWEPAEGAENQPRQLRILDAARTKRFGRDAIVMGERFYTDKGAVARGNEVPEELDFEVPAPELEHKLRQLVLANGLPQVRVATNFAGSDNIALLSVAQALSGADDEEIPPLASETDAVAWKLGVPAEDAPQGAAESNQQMQRAGTDTRRARGLARVEAEGKDASDELTPASEVAATPQPPARQPVPRTPATASVEQGGRGVATPQRDAGSGELDAQTLKLAEEIVRSELPYDLKVRLITALVERMEGREDRAEAAPPTRSGGIAGAPRETPAEEGAAVTEQEAAGTAEVAASEVTTEEVGPVERVRVRVTLIPPPDGVAPATKPDGAPDSQPVSQPAVTG